MRPESEDYFAEIVNDLEARGLLALAESVAKRHCMSLNEIIWDRGHLQAGARRDLWKAIYEHMPSYSQIARLFHLDCSTVRKGLAKRLKEQGGYYTRPKTPPFPNEGWCSCEGRDQQSPEE